MIIVWVLPAAGVFFGDLWIKSRIEKRMTEGETRALAGGCLLIRKHHNRGAVLNLGQHIQPLIAAISLALAGAVTVLFVFSLGSRGNNLLRVGLAFLLGGAFSNTYDRLRRRYVVDYFSFGVRWKRLRAVVFNVSDCFIIIGALLAALGVGA